MKNGLALIALVGGCVSYEAPPGFVEIDKGPFEWRAMSSQGVVIAVSDRPREGDGDAEFWAQVVRKELEHGRGYLFQSGRGSEDGMLFSAPGPENHSYLVVVHPREGRVLLLFPQKRVRIIEAGGPMKELEKEIHAIRDFARKLKPL